MAAAITMNDPLPTSVPRLEPNGSNWAIFSMRFQEAMEANQKWGHFDGSTAHPVPADPSKPTDDEKKAMAAWDLDETISHYMLSQQLPNSTAVHLKAITSVKDRWDKVKNEFCVKSQYAETDLLTAFSEIRCPRGGDVRAFLGTMRVTHNAQPQFPWLMGQPIPGCPHDSWASRCRPIPKILPSFMGQLMSGGIHIFPHNDAEIGRCTHKSPRAILSNSSGKPMWTH